MRLGLQHCFMHPACCWAVMLAVPLLVACRQLDPSCERAMGMLRAEKMDLEDRYYDLQARYALAMQKLRDGSTEPETLPSPKSSTPRAPSSPPRSRSWDDIDDIIIEGIDGVQHGPAAGGFKQAGLLSATNDSAHLAEQIPSQFIEGFVYGIPGPVLFHGPAPQDVGRTGGGWAHLPELMAQKHEDAKHVRRILAAALTPPDEHEAQASSGTSNVNQSDEPPNSAIEIARPAEHDESPTWVRLLIQPLDERNLVLPIDGDVEIEIRHHQKSGHPRRVAFTQVSKQEISHFLHETGEYPGFHFDVAVDQLPEQAQASSLGGASFRSISRDSISPHLHPAATDLLILHVRFRTLDGRQLVTQCTIPQEYLFTKPKQTSDSSPDAAEKPLDGQPPLAEPAGSEEASQVGSQDAGTSLAAATALDDKATTSTSKGPSEDAPPKWRPNR